jgi:hypothetical protein
MPLEIELLPPGWSHGVSSMPRILEKVQNYPQPVKYARPEKKRKIKFWYCNKTLCLLSLWSEYSCWSGWLLY